MDVFKKIGIAISITLILAVGSQIVSFLDSRKTMEEKIVNKLEAMGLEAEYAED